MRRRHPELFQAGEYLPLTVEGAKADHVIAFARKSKTASILVIVPHLVAGLLNDADSPPIGPQAWQDTHVVLPRCSCKHYRNAFTGEDLDLQNADGYATIAMSKALAEFPVALCSLA